MSVLALVAREINDARATGYKQIVHVRVTTDAIPGAPVSVPVTPERARVLGKLRAVWAIAGTDGGVVADPDWYERALELLMHPEDWADALKEQGPGGYGQEISVGDVTRIFGIPVG